MDEIVIYAKFLKEHDKKLDMLLNRLKTASLILQPEKCKLTKHLILLKKFYVRNRFNSIWI